MPPISSAKVTHGCGDREKKNHNGRGFAEIHRFTFISRTFDAPLTAAFASSELASATLGGNSNPELSAKIAHSAEHSTSFFCCLGDAISMMSSSLCGRVWAGFGIASHSISEWQPG